MKVTVTRPGDEKRKGGSKGKGQAPPLGEESAALAREVEKLEALYQEQKDREKKLARRVEERETQLTAIRAPAGLVDRVSPENLAAFKKELKTLQQELDGVSARATELFHQLYEKREALKEAQVVEAEAILHNEALEEVKKGLVENAGDLKAAQAAFLEALEAGAASLVQEVNPLLERWQTLVRKRHRLYARRETLTGHGDADREMATDSRVALFGKDYDVPAVLDLAETLLELVELHFGWPKVQNRKPRGRLWWR